MKKISKEFIKKEIKNISLVALGCFLIALADVLFIMPSNIINGGVDSLAIIVGHYLNPIFNFDVSDITIAIFQVALWLIGLLLLGIKFSIHTLLGSLLFPIFYSIMLRIDLINLIGMKEFYIRNTLSDGSLSLAFLLVSGIFGGLLSGAGVAFSFLGDGSTGGFDVISFIVAKYTKVQEDISGLIMDTSLILIGLFTFRNYELAFCGILSAIVCAMMIQFMYINNRTYLIVDIISTKEEQILNFIHNTLERGTTLIDSVGGYSKTKHKMIEVVINNNEAQELQKFIAFTDNKAFVSVVEAKNIHGNGFAPFILSNRAKREMLKKYGIKTKLTNR